MIYQYGTMAEQNRRDDYERSQQCEGRVAYLDVRIAISQLPDNVGPIESSAGELPASTTDFPLDSSVDAAIVLALIVTNKTKG